ncbi:MAG: glycosyltransferase [Candidatus Cloacimonetes bacterium]|nr:glycosyltransferase [Candidatus Cloacimonadota bacterium]MBS3767966.1 glycosyltransferase [Candidatus Cloacimonadota bacterium]
MTAYLQKHNWDIDVISVKEIVYHSKDKKLFSECGERKLYNVPSLDLMSILKLVSGGSKKVREKIYFSTPEKFKNVIRNLFPVDDKIGWLPFAYQSACRLSKKNDYDVIIATIGPYTSAVTAYLVAKNCKKPLVIDYRDPWILHPYLTFSTPLHKKIGEYWENKILHYAEVITTSSKKNKDDLCEKYGKNLNKKIKVMYNAWDERDFSGIDSPKNGKNVVFSYVGGFYGNQTPKFFIQALEELKNENKLPNDIRIQFVGNLFREEKEILANSTVNQHIEQIPQVPHKKAIQYMLSSNVLLLFITSIKSKGVVAGKVFEYIRAQKEILAMVPVEGETADILREYDYKFICNMENVETIKQNFIKLYEMAKENKTDKPAVDEKYSRKKQIYEFEKFLKKHLAGN